MKKFTLSAAIAAMALGGAQVSSTQAVLLARRLLAMSLLSWSMLTESRSSFAIVFLPPFLAAHPFSSCHKRQRRTSFLNAIFLR